MNILFGDPAAVICEQNKNLILIFKSDVDIYAAAIISGSKCVIDNINRKLLQFAQIAFNFRRIFGDI